MRLVRLLITLAILGGVAYFSVTVPLGQKTLWGHIKAVAGSRESKALVDGVKEKAERVLTRDSGPKPQDRLTKTERKLLRKLIKEKLADADSAPAPKN
jgi:hypothetical protein